jgi:hypothetical protein
VSLDPYRIVVFLHVLLFAYWLGSDLGVFICGTVGRSQKLSDDQRRGLREAGDLIDMAPRTCLVLMVPVGLTLSANYGSPIHGAPVLAAIWIAGLAWLWLVWQVHLQHNSALGKLFWKIDFAIRSLVMAGFIGFGGWCLATGGPIAGRWLAAKILLFGLIILCGIVVRILLLSSRRAVLVPAGAGAASAIGNRIRDVVFVIWGLVAVIAFIGVTKPF